ncbi:2-dehydropantoate 2-reductase [Vagococcus zengguangii]|uniref:2-dehydropantoate 2-reductase n=1 Tax=Vagococcus zengguangii TaxID=2571750 RepID=A0A4D7CS49_9ENTE|nr:2-dehydropantoate 2-reductase [Vagococcus zengguangii]QCI85694.1 2-dehydropantoate 2-reductase [Vagococcus zengguangii]TLG81636.1 2-dehydropantoate 2-reductase [Vagococcus zengguangii]
MKIVIAGAGAMGSRFGLMLHRAGNEVILVDGWADHVNAINENGLKANLNGEEVVASLPAFHKDYLEKEFAADLVIVFTKAMQLEGMMQSIKELLYDETKVLCLLNGIGHEEVIEKYVPLNNILLGNTMWTAGMVGPGEVKLFGNGSVDLQNLAPGQEEIAKEVATVLTEAGLNAKYSENILYSIYKKACVNGTMNGLCTILDVNMAGFGETKEADAIVEAIVAEFASVAKVEGVELNVPEVLAQIKGCYNRETIGEHFPSMHQDLITNNRLTEIDYINGAVARKGLKYDIATPYCTFLTQLVHVKEQILGAK